MRSKKQEFEFEDKMMIQSYEDIKAYERSYKAALDMYRIVKKYPREEMFGLTSQIKRASTSIPLNIAEGYGKRESIDEFKRFLLMAIGSCDEMKVLLSLSKDLSYINEQEYEKYRQEYNEIGKMLMVLRKNWK